jgi:hypothetical protein
MDPIAPVDELKHRLQTVITVGAPTQNTQHQVELGRGRPGGRRVTPLPSPGVPLPRRRSHLPESVLVTRCRPMTRNR